MSEMAAASQEQACGIDQVNKAIMQMDQNTQQNAALVEETAAASQSMQQRAGELRRLVEFFQVDNPSGGNSQAHPGTQERRAYTPQPTGLSIKVGVGKHGAQAFPGDSRARRSREPMGVETGNGHASHPKEENFFEEF